MAALATHPSPSLSFWVQVHSLEVFLGQLLSMEAQISAVAQSAFCQLWLTGQLCPYLDRKC